MASNVESDERREERLRRRECDRFRREREADEERHIRFVAKYKCYPKDIV